MSVRAPHVTPQNEWQRENDIISWRNLGRPQREREPMRRDPRLCTAMLRNGYPCSSWSNRSFNGAPFCNTHAPAGSLAL